MIFVWTVGDVVTLALFAIMGLILLYFWIADAIREGRCKHDKGVTETRACDAICIGCGKNLGFIGAWRKRTGNGKDLVR